MTSQTFKAVVLRTRDVGEADCIVHLLTDRHGRVAARAASARRSLKRFGGALDTGVLVQAQATQVRGRDLWRLDVCDPLAARPRVKNDYQALSRAALMIELVFCLVGQNDPCPEIFELLAEGLARLDAAADRTAERTVVVVFMARMLAATGFAPHLRDCRGCGRSVTAQASVTLSAARGGVICNDCAGEAGGPALPGLDRGGLITLQKAISSPLDQAWRLRFSGAALTEAERFLFRLAQHAADKPLKSLKALSG
ncbi:MAG: DNA repair protein RecO [Proteobacteria bacterium]|nr:DNA repair protein RecO [Pseudomonadota bacterium]MBU1742111.1 DNA repair protein RecO [Pseudomonadota bacterium]